MRELRVKSLKIVFKDGNDYEVSTETGLDKGEVVDYIERVFGVELAEPLIRDKYHPERAEKVRKTLRMWADTNGFKVVSYRVDSFVSVFHNECNPVECATAIEFGWIMEGLKPGTYAISELCGDDKDDEDDEAQRADEY